MLFLHHLSFLFGLYFAGKSLFTNWKYLSGCIRIVDKNTTKNESITLFKFLKVIPILSRFKVFTFEPSAKTLQSCLTLRPHRRQPTRLPSPWDSPGKNTGVGCHFLLQCMTVKSESEVARSSPTLCDPMDCSLPGSSVHGIFQARVLEWGAIGLKKKSR